MNVLIGAVTGTIEQLSQRIKEQEIIINMFKADAEQWRKGHERYEKLRKLSASEYQELCFKKYKTGEHFDDLVDQLPFKWN